MSSENGASPLKSLIPQTRTWRSMKRSAKRFSKKMLGWFVIGVGLIFFFVGLPVALLPGHLGLPFVVIGLIMVLRNAMWARRQFIHLKRRHPNWIMPIRKLLRRRPQVASVFWQATLRTERLILRSRRFLANLRRRFLRRPRFSASL